jgi:hypothetical protein
MLGIEPRALWKLGKSSTTEVHLRFPWLWNSFKLWPECGCYRPIQIFLFFSLVLVINFPGICLKILFIFSIIHNIPSYPCNLCLLDKVLILTFTPNFDNYSFFP